MMCTGIFRFSRQLFGLALSDYLCGHVAGHQTGINMISSGARLYRRQNRPALHFHDINWRRVRQVRRAYPLEQVALSGNTVFIDTDVFLRWGRLAMLNIDGYVENQNSSTL